MKGLRRAGFVLVALLFLRAASAGPPRRRAVLLSFDALGGQRLASLMEEPGKLPAGAFRRLAERGFFAVRSVPPSPSLTAVSHLTIVSGAPPRATGIVSNNMLDREKPFGTTISGFNAPIRAETLWQAAHRQGKRVGVVLYPGATGGPPERSADWAMIWPGGALVASQLHSLGAEAWGEGSAEGGTFSPARRVRLTFGKTEHAVAFVALDSVDDRRVAYDQLRIEPELGEPRTIRLGEWFPVEVREPAGRTGAWCKVLFLSPDLSRAEIYMGGLHRNKGYPEEFLRILDERLGFWPGAPDAAVLGSRSDFPEVFMEQADRLTDFVTRAALLAIGRSDWDLLLLYQPQVDEVTHEFLLVDPAQRGYTPERVERFRGFVEAGFALADRSLDAIARALGAEDSLFVTSDHGMTPVWEAIYPNELLRRAGLLRQLSDGKTDPASAAVAVTDGGSAHVYVNPQAPPETLEKVEKLFTEFRVRGESPWDRVVRRGQAGPLGLDAPESGDLIVLTRPGTTFRRGAGGNTPLVGEPVDHGAHGYRNGFRDLHATFLAAGPGIVRGRVKEIDSRQIATRVAKSLGIDPPREAARPGAESRKP
jgi:predicted AlkP superfamily pyrophosphatase or phosphodiesterase